MLHDQLVGEELQGVGLAVAGRRQRGASGGEQVGVAQAGGGELMAQAVDDAQGGVVGCGVGPRRGQNCTPEIRCATAVAAAPMYGATGVEAR